MLRFVRRTSLSGGKKAANTLIAIACALVASGVMVALLGQNPFDVYAKLIEGSLGTNYRLVQTINKAIPLVILSLAVSVAFKMRFWNIGGEGQLYMGGFGAALVAFRYPTLSPPLLLLLMAVTGMLCGALWALIPALLKSRFGASESLTTLMMNYIAIQWVTYLQNGPWRDPAGTGMPRIAQFPENAILPEVFGVHIGWIIALALVGLMYVLLNRSKLGFEVSVLGESEMTARYAGMSVRRIMITAVLLSGGLCGLTGMIQASAIERSLSSGFSGGLGFTAIVTAWLGKLSPVAIVIVSFLFAMLLQGGNYIQAALQVSATVSSMIQGVVLFFILGSDFFMQYRVEFKGKGKEVAAS
jgi:simple sugar transport system permease protein